MSDTGGNEGRDGFVVASAAMRPPERRRYADKRPYLPRADAPATHARLYEAEGENAFALQFNGEDLISLRFPKNVKPLLRYHSDGDFQSWPFIQQFVAAADAPCELEVVFSALVELWNVRPRRAGEGEAILGQVGNPLMFGANGMYLPDWDMLLSWHGMPFRWVGRRVASEGGRWVARMAVSAGNKPWVLLIRPRYFSEHLGYARHRPWARRPDPKPVAGWCSWEAYHSDVTQSDIERAAASLAPLRAYGLEYMQLDDGFQQERVPLRVGGDVGESWLAANGKFPGGHEAIVRAMRGGGFRPGIWTNATLTDEEGAESTGACLRDREERLIKGDWIRFVIDCLPETLERHVKPYFRAFRELGYEYVKSDSIRHLIYDGLQEAVRLGTLEPEDARARFAAYLDAVRESVGDAYFLSCWGVLSESIGACDAMRVSTDAGPSWGAISMQLRETARWFFAQRILFTLDPDHVCVRAPLVWVRMLLSFVSLSGGLYMISDEPERYDEPRLELIRKTLPALPTRAAEIGPVDYTSPACARAPRDMDPVAASRLISHIDGDAAPFATLWATHFDRGERSWCVIQRCAAVPLAVLDVPLERFALDPDRTYRALSFWTQETRELTGAIRFEPLELGDTEVWALTDVTDGRPALLGSDRHVSMDAVSAVSVEADEHRVTLRLRGLIGQTIRYTVYAPNLAGEAAASGESSVRVEAEGEILRLSVRFAEEDVEVSIR